ncbi:DNA-binding protein [Corallococcus sp. CA054B]|uniref:helix-turn-helix domain-containing protein n=1 Tax=Corallococcus sp. CA054B TaxID=2316734 RepID=UPI000EA1FBD5|nr:helix-turn-helix domain-containing protein [Corallococcus sp. CA054B]RKG63513.1 DNA-binding protein [Corallococcus sp. CA054B]
MKMPSPHEAKPSTNETLWDANDVADFLKVSRSWVYQHAASGLLPLLKIGGLLRFSPSAIRTWAFEQPVLATVRVGGGTQGG